MKQYVKIIKKDWGYYSAVEYSLWTMYLIANFFIQDINDDISHCMNRLDEENDALFGMSGNWASLEKDEQGYVIMTDVVTERDYDPEPVPLEHSLLIKPAELIKLLYKWEELYKKQAPEIMITKDGNSFEMFEVKPQI